MRSSSSGLRSPALKTHEEMRRLQAAMVDVPLFEVDIGFLAKDVCISSTYTLDFGQGIHDFTLSVNICVEETQNMLDSKASTDI